MNDPTGQGRAPVVPSRNTLIAATIGAAVVAALIVFGAVLPAEYDQDPLGLGRATGLTRLWAPPQIDVAASDGAQPVARSYPVPFRTDEVVVPLKSIADPSFGNMIEYKVRMKKGATLVYSWVAEGLDEPDQLYFDFHGHTLTPSGAKVATSVSKYAKGTGDHANGALVAPFDGIHGWLLQNAAPHAVRVRVKLAGFYELIPLGEEGNLGTIQSGR
jgi:hypothetical protein